MSAPCQKADIEISPVICPMMDRMRMHYFSGISRRSCTIFSCELVLLFFSIRSLPLLRRIRQSLTDVSWPQEAIELWSIVFCTSTWTFGFFTAQPNNIQRRTEYE